MTTLRQHLNERHNDYGALEDRYRDAGLGELVIDPFGSYHRRSVDLSRSVSVLIGSYNCGESLARVLVALEESSFNRGHPDLLEVIVVDDGSTDGTSDLVRGLELDLTLRLLRQQRGGLSAAHNTGLACARGDIVVLLDSDVVLTPWALEELMKRHELLDDVTLAGFRFEIDSHDERLRDASLRAELPRIVPAFFHDFRVEFPGHPTNMCRETSHLKAFGCGNQLRMANGATYDLPAMVVGAFFSIARSELLRMGGSDERLRGWGCEDSVIGAQSIALGNYVVPVYSAAGAHISHPRRDPDHRGQFARNLATAQAILTEDFTPTEFDPERSRARVQADWSCRAPGRRRVREPPDSYPLGDENPSELGHCLFALGRFDEAVEMYDRWATLEPESPWPPLGRAKSLRQLGDRDGAVRLLSKLAARHPNNDWAHLELGLALAAVHDFGTARRALEVARDLSASFFEPAWVLDNPSDHHKRRGNFHAAQGYHHVAVTDFELALIVDDASPWAHFDRALSLRALGRPEDALSALQRADALLHPEDGNRTWLHSALAHVHLERGDYGESKVEVERALRLFPDNAEARCLCSRMHKFTTG